VFDGNFWNLEQEQLSQMPAGNGVITKAKHGLLEQSPAHPSSQVSLLLLSSLFTPSS
jgi:hypothetical protein